MDSTLKMQAAFSLLYISTQIFPSNISFKSIFTIGQTLLLTEAARTIEHLIVSIVTTYPGTYLMDTPHKYIH